MRLTNVLFKLHIGRKFKRLWRDTKKMQLAPLEIPPELQAMGVKIHDAMEFVKEHKKNQKLDELLLDEVLPLDLTQMKKYYLFDNKTRISEDGSILLSLIKAISYKGLPGRIQSLVGVEEFPNQNELVQNHILQSLVLDSHQNRLPKIIDVKKPGYIFPRTYGIRHKRKACNLIQKLAFMAEMQIGKFPGSLERSRTIDAFTEVTIDRCGDPVTFQLNSNIVVTSKTPLRRFSTNEEVESTKQIELPPIYPVKPTIDLWQSESNPSMFSQMNQYDNGLWMNNNVHTLHIVHETFGYWHMEQKVCRAIATCFTFATEEARKLYGRDVSVLPEPVCIQCIYSDTKNIGVLAFQLNTLELDSNDGIKNQVWVQDSQQLYSDITDMREIKDFNKNIFRDMLAVYLNGLHPLSL